MLAALLLLIGAILAAAFVLFDWARAEGWRPLPEPKRQAPGGNDERVGSATASCCPDQVDCHAGYELVGVVEELGPDCSRLRVGDRIGALTAGGADADRVCLPEAGAVGVPEDLDPAEVLSLLFPYMTAYQVLHRTAIAKRGETVPVHGAAGRVGTAVLELGALAPLPPTRRRAARSTSASRTVSSGVAVGGRFLASARLSLLSRRSTSLWRRVSCRQVGGERA